MTIDPNDILKIPNLPVMLKGEITPTTLILAQNPGGKLKKVTWLTFIAALSTALTPIAPIPITPHPGYPAEVVRRGYQTTFDYSLRAAPTPTKILLTEVAAGRALPTGWGFDGPSQTLYISASGDHTGWDLRDAKVYRQTSTTVIFRNSQIGRVHIYNGVYDYAVRNGDDGGVIAGGMELHGCQVDGSTVGAATSDWSSFNTAGISTLKAYDTNFIDASYRHYSGRGEFYRCYFGKINMHGNTGLHLEQLFANHVVYMEDCFLDAYGSITGGGSGNIQCEGNTNLTMVRCITRGCTQLGALVAFQGAGGCVLSFINNIIEPGTSGAGILAKNGSTTSGTGNTSYTTGLSVDAAVS